MAARSGISITAWITIVPQFPLPLLMIITSCSFICSFLPLFQINVFISSLLFPRGPSVLSLDSLSDEMSIHVTMGFTLPRDVTLSASQRKMGHSKDIMVHRSHSFLLIAIFLCMRSSIPRNLVGNLTGNIGSFVIIFLGEMPY